MFNKSRQTQKFFEKILQESKYMYLDADRIYTIVKTKDLN